MAIAYTRLATGSLGGVTTITTGAISCAAGDLLVVCSASATAGNAVTSIHSNLGSSGSPDFTNPGLLSNPGSAFDPSNVWYKVATGSETSVTINVTNTTGAAYLVAKYTGWTNTPTFVVGDDDESGVNSAADKDFGFGSAALSASYSTGAAILSLQNDRYDRINNVLTGPSGYTSDDEFHVATSGTAIWFFHKDLSSTATETPTASTTDSGDENYGQMLIFGDAPAASGRTATAAITLGVIQLTSESAILLKASSGVTLGAVALTATATMSSAGITGTASITLGDVVLAATGTVLIEGQLSTTLGIIALTATGAEPSASRVGQVAIALDLVSLVSTGTMAQPPSGVPEMIGKFIRGRRGGQVVIFARTD